ERAGRPRRQVEARHHQGGDAGRRAAVADALPRQGHRREVRRQRDDRRRAQACLRRGHRVPPLRRLQAGRRARRRTADLLDAGPAGHRVGVPRRAAGHHRGGHGRRPDGAGRQGAARARRAAQRARPARRGALRRGRRAVHRDAHEHGRRRGGGGPRTGGRGDVGASGGGARPGRGRSHPGHLLGRPGRRRGRAQRQRRHRRGGTCDRPRCGEAPRAHRRRRALPRLARLRRRHRRDQPRVARRADADVVERDGAQDGRLPVGGEQRGPAGHRHRRARAARGAARDLHRRGGRHPGAARCADEDQDGDVPDQHHRRPDGSLGGAGM
ncbi:MAG: Acetylglutamate kinase, partial [uncultured Nocardioidaceae bacterium]